MDALDAFLLASYASQGLQILAFPVPSSVSTLEMLTRARKAPGLPDGHPAAGRPGAALRLAALGLLTAAATAAALVPLSVCVAPQTAGWWGSFGAGRAAALGPLAAACLIAGNVVSYAAVVALRRAVAFHPHGEAANLLTAGIYARIRNPITLGLALLTAGYFFYFPSLATLAGWALFHLNAHIRVRMEEGLLEQQFGDAYRCYKRRVGRYSPKKKNRGLACTP